MRVDIIDRDYDPAGIREPFSVCMTVKNEAATIQAFLATLFLQTLQSDDIVIVDGGSEDGTIEKLWEEDQVRSIVRVGFSPAAGRNFAARVAKHDLQVTLDAGTVLRPNLLANLIGPMLEPDPPELTAGTYGAIRQSPWNRYFIPNWSNDGYLRESFLPSCRALAIRRGLIEKCGGFPEKFQQRWGEDTAFMLKAKELSSRWVINRAAYVGWDCPATAQEACDLAYKYGMGNGEIGAAFYTEAYLRSNDPVMRAALAGYKAGTKLREEQKQ